MTVGVSTVNTANAWLNCIRASGATRTVVAGTWVKLHTGDPGAAGASNAAVGSTTRVALTQAAASGGAIAMNGTAPVWTNGGTSETITHISVWDDSSAGNFLYSVALTASQAWVSGNTLTLQTCGVSITPLAA
jgi:phosphopantothenoylcysteine synthetase/decarboxylase